MIFMLEHIKEVENFQCFLLICFCISFHPDSEGGWGNLNLFYFFSPLKIRNSNLKNSPSERINFYLDFPRMREVAVAFTVPNLRC